MRVEYVEDIDVLYEVGMHWMAEHRGKEFGFDVTAESIIADAKEWLATEAGCVIGLVDEKEGYVGFMSLFCVPKFLGLRPIAFEKYWYVIPEFRIGAILMMNEAKRWAKAKGASHLILSASAMASDMHKHLCDLYERLHMQLFETSYITEL